jgi:cytochrome c-type biogenesis protein CcmH
MSLPLRSLAILWLPLVLAAAPPEDQQKRVQALENKLLAPCCYQEPVARHQSDVAVNMRTEIAKLVSAGKSDDDIVKIYVQRYGKEVVADFAPTPGWATWAPWALALVAAAALAWRLPHMVRRKPAES